ncbi:SIS domain-containing protein [Salisediminibacterium selenitireducens]|uniref:UPF0309 protein Bsel_0176 n=1 Tax=Bacillus selenitireducens (strain ATCC 700615 / DSM 15326 / MLS10) TaxID=439292 RepID=D6XVV1_BACIE|nr:SIS domain-containing protein [Salisediminibacterium selenitireducens]ADH97724.1 conserved hypothetical protein [[Bacillus] selenitireducens MLS10]
MSFRYLDEIESRLRGIKNRQFRALTVAAEQIAATIRNDGMIYVFGSGHSHMLGEELFYRAGGLANVRPLFVEPLMLHESGPRASALERTPGYAERFMTDLPLTPKDLMIVVSTSGRNPVPVDAAMISREKGAYVIAVTSMAYRAALSSRHPSGQHLSDAADLVLDNEAPVGDAALSHKALDTGFAPVSTILGITLLQAVIAEATETLAEEGFDVPVFKSGNVDGADAHNEALISRFKDRNPALTP